MIDRTPPENVKAYVSENPLVGQQENFVSFSATDNTSGIDRYEICLRKGIFGTGPCTQVSNPYLIAGNIGELGSRVIVRAIDKAGNKNEVLASLTTPGREFALAGPSLAIILGAVIIAGLIWMRKFLAKRAL